MVEGDAVPPIKPTYSERTIAVYFLARRQAMVRGSATVEIEDLILGIVVEDQGGLLEELSKPLGVKIDLAHMRLPHRPYLPRDVANDLRVRLEALCRRSAPLPPGTETALSGSAKYLFEVADLLRETLRQSKLEPIHLLAAAVWVESSSAVQMLRDAGITRDSVVRAARGEDT